MDIWKVLGIAPTKNKDEIVQAYRDKLTNTNPEDKPEEFMELRNAYEEALDLCQRELAGGYGKVDEWLKKLDDLYQDFPSRVVASNWEKLFDDEVCFSLDSKPRVEEELLHYLMEKYFLSHDVFLVMDDIFHFSQRAEELYENYPKDFIDYVILNGIYYEDILPLNMFSQKTNEQDCKDYLNIYRQLQANSQDQGPMILQLEQMEESHPYGDAAILSYHIKNGERDISQLVSLAEKYDYDHRIAVPLANTFSALKQYEDAVNVLEKSMQRYPERVDLKWVYVDNLIALKEYVKAKDALNELSSMVDGDRMQLYEINQKRSDVNDHLIASYEEKIKESPNDDDLKSDLAWAYLQNNRIKEAEELARTLTVERDPFDYYNLLCNVEFYSNNISEGLKDLDLLIEVIRNMKDDGTEKTRKRMKRLVEMMERKAFYQCADQDMEGGIATFEEAISLEPENAEALSEYGNLLFGYKKYDRTEEIARELVRLRPTAYHGRLLLAKTLFEKGMDREAFDVINKALELNGSDLEAYVLKLRILIRNNAWDAAKELVKFLEDSHVGEDPAVGYCKGNILEFCDHDIEAAKDIYEKTIKKIEDGAYSPLAVFTYYRYLLLIGDTLDGNKKEDRDTLMSLAEKGLQIDEDHYGLLDYKAWLLRKDGQDDKALDIYMKLLDNPHHSTDVEYQIGLIYYDDLDLNVEKAIDFFNIALEGGNKDALFYLGYCHYYMGDIDASEDCFLKLRKFYEEEKTDVIDIDSFYRMSYIYEARKDYENALVDAKKALDNAIKKKSKLDRYFNRVITLLRAMNRPKEAVEYAYRKDIKTGSNNGRQLATEIYFQFGMLAEAKECIDKRLKKRTENDISAAVRDLVLYYQLMDNYSKAKLAMIKYHSSIKGDDKMTVQLNNFEHEDRHIDMAKIHQAKLQNAKSKNDYVLFNYLQISEDYFFDGNRQKKLEFADLAQGVYEHERGRFTTRPALYHIALARIKIMKEEYEAAYKELELARNSYCSDCKYCKCKDADLFEIFALIGENKFDEAKDKCDSAAKQWPEDPCFMNIKKNLKGK